MTAAPLSIAPITASTFGVFCGPALVFSGALADCLFYMATRPL